MQGGGGGGGGGAVIIRRTEADEILKEPGRGLILQVSS